MHLRSLGFRTDLALLRAGGTEVEDRGDHLVVRSPHNPTFWWGNFLLLAEAPDAAGSGVWLARFAAAFPEAAHVALGVDGARGTTADLRWFAEHGFDVDASTVMTATRVHEPRHRNEIAVCRELVSDADWAQSVELTLRCFGVESGSDRGFVTAKAVTNRRVVGGGAGGWFGAFVDGVLVAQLGLLRAGPGLARFQSVETDPAHRRRGIAGTLVHRAARFGFDTLAADTLVMVADPDYFALDLYRAVGFTATESQLQAQLRQL